MKTILFALLMCIAVTSNAQKKFKCASHNHFLPKTTIIQMEKQIENFIDTFNSTNRQLQILEIPVVVHVIYNQNLTRENLSMVQIQEQIDILNRDFRRMNTDKDSVHQDFQNIIADMQIEFCLIAITRTSTTETGFTYWNNHIKFDSTGGKDAWNPDEYLNIWIGNLSGGLLGYAQFPNTGLKATDGVVIDYMTVGEDTTSYPLYKNYAGRVAVHEIGHWLNLRHIWADNASCNSTDFVDDTPTQHYLYSSCHKDTSTCGSRDFVMNYMDYVPCWCMRAFTEGQKMRAWASIALWRNQIYNNSCSLTQVQKVPLKDGIKIYPIPTKDQITIEVPEGIEGLNINILDSSGRIIYKSNITDSKVTIYFENAAGGLYYVMIHKDFKIIKSQIISLIN